MRALVWIIEDTWQATIDDAADFLPSDAEITLLHVASTEPETVAFAARRGLLGRHPARDAQPQSLPVISEQAATELLADAQSRLGRPATLRALRGRVKHEVVAAAESMDILVLARDGDRERLGPRSLGPDARFVVDHAPCRVLLIWPDSAPDLATIPPPPRAPPPLASPPDRRP
ncbi:MAG: universal stress protein [Solirubrobacteraceae bacterium]